MARLHEHQGKALLESHGVAIPQGQAVSTPQEARAVAERLGGRVVLKVQAWVTGRAAKGGVVFASAPEEAEEAARRLLAMRFGDFPVSEVLVERALDIQDELFVSLTIDDAAQAPVLLLDWRGGSGIEERAETVTRLPVDVNAGVDRTEARRALGGSPIDGRYHDDIVAAIEGIVKLARAVEARSLEVNPLVTTPEGGVVAADCRMTIDDYAVFRHPDLNISIARELDHPATELERIAYRVEQADHRGTFYFAQLAAGAAPGSCGLIGFHGAGGGGSMMSMDAVAGQGFTLANYCDTSGNPSAAKVYRAARIILAQPGLVGYFGSGSGVASQEQYHSAYGLAKAFWELELCIPAVIRLGGNSEDRAVKILDDVGVGLPGRIECYRKDDAPDFVAARFAELVEQAGGVAGGTWSPRPRRVPGFVGSSYRFPISGGAVWIDHDGCDAQATEFVVANSSGLLEQRGGLLVLAVAQDKVAARDSELVALEVECRRANHPVVFVDLPIPGLDS